MSADLIFGNASARTLGMARIWVFGLAAISRLLFPLWEICLLPDYSAVGIMRLLGADYWIPLLTPPAAVAIQGGTVALLLAAAAGVGPYRLIATLACIALTVSEGMARGVGHIPHSNLSLIFVAYVLASFPSATDAFSLTGKGKPQRTNPAEYQSALVVACLVFLIPYSLVAVRRMMLGGWEIYTDHSILVSIATRDGEIGELGGWGVKACESKLFGWMLVIGFPFVTLVEWLSPLCLFSRWFRWIWVSVMIGFHIGVGIVMGGWFPYNLGLIPLLAAGFNPFHRRNGEGSSAAS
ncbi:MAG: hypothetical protein ACR2RV_16045 [Verrucomicrobiales bacterium]